MDKSERSETEQQPRRPAARRALREHERESTRDAIEPHSEPAAHVPTWQDLSTATPAKRVHARRPRGQDATQAHTDVTQEVTREMRTTPQVQPPVRSSLPRTRSSSTPPTPWAVPAVAHTLVGAPPPPISARRGAAADSGGLARRRSTQTQLTSQAPDASDIALSTRTAMALARGELAEEFGLDGSYEAKMRPLLETLCRSYFHIQVIGAHNIPARGRVLLVANHSLSLPWDGIMLRTALRLHHDARREARWLVEDAQYHTPFLGTVVNRLGAVRACQENAERLLARDELVAVFPEGSKGAHKRFDDRYRLQRFGRGGYVKLALRTGAPVLPVAIVATEERSPWLSKLASVTRWASMPMFALQRSFPNLGALGLPPMPSRWRIVIGEPIREIARQDAEATRDDGLIHELNECVRSAVQLLVDTTVAAATSAAVAG
jgi:1-acyl-sn-glycerol-3-phosphate acyltransferase